MALIKDEAFVLRRLDFSETSQVLAIFTRDHGQQSVLYKGAKRATKTRASIGIDLLEKGDAVFSLRPGKEDRMATLTDWRQRDGFRHLRNSLGALYSAEYAADVTLSLTERHDAHPPLFDSINSLFNDLAAPPYLDSVARFQWELLTHVGLQPEMRNCAACGKDTSADEILFFSSHQGGALCRDCETHAIEKRRLSRATADVLIDASKRSVGRAFMLLDYHLRETIGRPPRLSKMLQSALRDELKELVDKRLLDR